MAVRLHGIPRPDRFPLGKPLFPDQQLSRDHPELVDMVGPNSWLIFELLDCQGGWLSQNPAEWDNDDEYVRMYGIVRHLAVVNDTAERSVKDVQEYANSAKDGHHRGEIILVSSSHRIKLPQFLKNEMNENL